jgi:hypothetical protein
VIHGYTHVFLISINTKKMVGLNDWRFESRQGLGIYLLTIASRPALETTQPPNQWVPVLFPWG